MTSHRPGTGLIWPSPPHAGENLTVSVDMMSTALEQLAPEWLALVDDAERPDVFMLPSYHRAWLRTVASDVAAEVIVVRRAGMLIGLLPIMRARVWRGPSGVPRHDYAPSDRAAILGHRFRPFPLRQISSVVSLPATKSAPGLICRNGEAKSVIDAVGAALLKMRRWDVIVLPAWDDLHQDLWTASLRAAGANPWIHRLDRFVQGIGRVRPFEEIVATQNRNFRRNVRRAAVVAERLGLQIAMVRGRDAVLRQMDTFSALARASWKHEGRPETQLLLPYAGRQQQFFEDLLADRRLDAEPVIAIATERHNPVAALLCLRRADVLHAMLLFWNGEADKASPGLMLLKQMVDWAAGNDIRTFHLHATQEWVRHVADEKHAINNVVVFAPTVAGRLVAGSSRLAQARSGGRR
jgi:CelD/BcsL family acetyltransferase involved in cellulose biosynthesis